LRKLPIDCSEWNGKSLEQLTADEVYILAKTLPGVTQSDRHRIYKGVLQEFVQAGYLKAGSLAIVRQMQEKLGMSEEEYEALWVELGSDPENAHLFYPIVPQTELRDRGRTDFPQTLIRQKQRN
jgi:hypothetical protein